MQRSARTGPLWIVALVEEPRAEPRAAGGQGRKRLAMASKRSARGSARASARAKVPRGDETGKLLFEAAERGDVGLVTELVGRPEAGNVIDFLGDGERRTPLFAASQNGHHAV